MKPSTDALTTMTDIHRVVCAFVVVIGENGTGLDVHILPDDAVANKVEMGNGTAFKYYRGLDLTTDADLCTGSQKYAVPKIRMSTDKTVCRNDGWCFDGYIVSDDGCFVYGHTVLNIITQLSQAPLVL